jgi:polar amino acid transport system permease protein
LAGQPSKTRRARPKFFRAAKGREIISSREAAMSRINFSTLLPAMLEGTVTSLEIFFLTLIIALPVGLLVAAGRMSKWKAIRWPIQAYLLVMRGTPLMLQLLFFYFGPSIPIGQHEAAASLGYTRRQTFFKIILPQVVKRITPPMGNEFMTLVKDTALAQVIAVSELFDISAKAASGYVSTVPFVVAAIFYLVMNFFVGQGFLWAERKLDYYR